MSTHPTDIGMDFIDYAAERLLSKISNYHGLDCYSIGEDIEVLKDGVENTVRGVSKVCDTLKALEKIMLPSHNITPRLRYEDKTMGVSWSKFFNNDSIFYRSILFSVYDEGVDCYIMEIGKDFKGNIEAVSSHDFIGNDYALLFPEMNNVINDTNRVVDALHADGPALPLGQGIPESVLVNLKVGSKNLSLDVDIPTAPSGAVGAPF